jgi:hypothetical protein
MKGQDEFASLPNGQMKKSERDMVSAPHCSIGIKHTRMRHHHEEQAPFFIAASFTQHANTNLRR